MKTRRINLKGFEASNEVMNNPIFDRNIDKYALELFPSDEIKNITPLPNQFVYIISVIENKVILCSDNIKKITGYNPEELTMEILLSNVHPDDKHIYSLAIKISYLYGQNPSKGAKHNFLKINYRFRKKNGEYIKLLRYSFLVNEDKTGHMAHYKSVCTDINDIKNDNKIDIKIYQDDKIFYAATSEELDSRFKSLTKREAEISNLLSSGYSSNEIAKKNYISRHTVDTHRRNIIRKLGLKDTKELVYGR